MIETASYLGPATVTRAEGRPGWVEVRLPGAEPTWARLAFALPYRPAEGDELLVIRQDSAYAIGVLSSSGPATIQVSGDLVVEARGGMRFESAKPIELRSGDAVRAEAPEVVLRAGRLELAARRAIQRFQDAYVWLKGLYQVKCRRYRAVADEGLLVKSGRTHLKSEGDVSIDGKTIHLG